MCCFLHNYSSFWIINRAKLLHRNVRWKKKKKDLTLWLLLLPNQHTGETFPFLLWAEGSSFCEVWLIQALNTDVGCRQSKVLAGTAGLSRALAGWSEPGGCRGWVFFFFPSHFKGLKLFWCFVWVTLTFSLCGRLSLSHKPLPQHFPSVMDCVSLKVLLVIGGLWKIYNRWAVFEGYVLSNYLFAEGFGFAVAQPNVPPTQTCCRPALYSLPCEADWILGNQWRAAQRIRSDTWSQTSVPTCNI